MPTGHYDRTHLRTNLVGQTIGFAQVLGLDHRAKERWNFWKCKCLKCGKIFVRSQQNLMKHKKDANCGCYSKEKAAIGNAKRYVDSVTKKPHGKRIYEIHHGMIQRCENPNSKHYRLYGGRGISICPEWRNDVNAFYEWAMANGYQDNLSIDRIDVNKGYFPDNCRWATSMEQLNNRQDTVRYEYKGQLYTVTELARHVDIFEETLRHRLQKGMSVEDACAKTNYQNGKPIGENKKRKR